MIFIFCILRIRNSKKILLNFLKGFYLRRLRIKIIANLVLAMSKGMELKAVTKPDIIDAQKCKPRPSLKLTLQK